MARMLGLTDDMLIIRGVDVYPSQTEKAILEMRGVEPHFLLIVDRRKELDCLEVWVEASESVFSDDTREIRAFEERVESHLRAVLNVKARVMLKDPKFFQRGAGKAKRVMHLRVEGPPDYIREELRRSKGEAGL